MSPHCRAVFSRRYLGGRSTAARRRPPPFSSRDRFARSGRRCYLDAPTGVLLYWRRTTTVIMSARADRRTTVLSLDLLATDDRTTRETGYCTLDARPSRRPRVDRVLIDGRARCWQGVARLIRRVQRWSGRRQIGRPPSSLACVLGPGHRGTEASQTLSALIPR